MLSTPAIYELGPDFYDLVAPAIFPKSILRYRNQEAAQKIGLENFSDERWIEHFGRFKGLPENMTAPLALRYHGHQFLHYNTELGDGRGFLFAQFRKHDKLYDLGTKGSGQTPYSRQGDGKLTLKGAFREILATELLASYGVNTSQTFSVIETGEKLQRHDEPSPTRSAVLVRLSHSHIRFGTFQRLAYLDEKENIQKLTEYCIKNYYPELSFQDPNIGATAFFQNVMKTSIDMVASWMISGFVHGVMNTDNMNITGESFDYGPYRFLPSYDPDFVAAYFDHQGLYSFGRQPITLLWNLNQLGKCLTLAFPQIPISEILEGFEEVFNAQMQNHLLRRLNLIENEHTQELLETFFHFLKAEKAPFEQTFFDLFSGIQNDRLLHSPQSSLYQKSTFKDLKQSLSRFKIKDETKLNHPYFMQPFACSLLINELEKIWLSISSHDDWTPFTAKLDSIRSFRGVYS